MLAVRSLSELRVGNWVQDTQHFLGYFQLQGVNYEYGGFIAASDQWIPFDEVAGIKITKRWLEEFGAKPFPDGESLELSNRLIGFAECRNVFFDRATGVELLFVHQTQNLFYALTGQELVRQNDR